MGLPWWGYGEVPTSVARFVGLFGRGNDGHGDGGENRNVTVARARTDL